MRLFIVQMCSNVIHKLQASCYFILKYSPNVLKMSLQKASYLS